MMSAKQLEAIKKQAESAGPLLTFATPFLLAILGIPVTVMTTMILNNISSIHSEVKEVHKEVYEVRKDVNVLDRRISIAETILRGGNKGYVQ